MAGWDENLGRTLLVGRRVIIGSWSLADYCCREFLPKRRAPRVRNWFLAVSLLVIILASSWPRRDGIVNDRRSCLAGLLIAETEISGEVEVITPAFKGLALGRVSDHRRHAGRYSVVLKIGGSCSPPSRRRRCEGSFLPGPCCVLPVLVPVLRRKPGFDGQSSRNP